MDVYVKIRKWNRSVLLAACDAELLGKNLREGEIVFEICEDFYKGSKVRIEEAITLIRQSTVANMVGKNIVNKAKEKGLIHPDAILKISGIPHAQIIRM